MMPVATQYQGNSPMARFMEARGRRILEGCGSLWHSVEGGLLISFPYHQELSPAPADLNAFLQSSKANGLRFPSTNWNGTASGAYLCRTKAYNFPSIHHSFRQKVRKAQAALRVREVTEEELLEQGRQLNLDTMERQGRRDNEFEDAVKWRRLAAAITHTPGVAAWGAFRGDELAAYMVLCREDGVLQILHQMSRAKLLSLYPNHALTFEVTRQAMADPGLEMVCYGLESLVQNPGLHNYKLDFGYEFVQHNSVIALHPFLSFLTSRPVRSLVEFIRQRRPEDQRLERIDSVLRTAAQSKLPLAA